MSYNQPSAGWAPDEDPPPRPLPLSDPDELARLLEAEAIDRANGAGLYAPRPAGGTRYTVEDLDRLQGKRPTGPGRIVDMREAMRVAMTPLPYRAGPLAIDGFITLLVGRRGEHKSWLGQFACWGVHSDQPVGPLGQRHGRAVYLDAEGGARLMGRRMVITGMDEQSFVYADGVGLHLPGDIAQVRELVDHTGANLLVLDSLRRLAPTMKENDSDSTAPVMESLAMLAREQGCAIVAIHHRSTKPGAPDVRGSSALEDQADIVWQLEKVRGDPDGRHRRRLRNTKMRVDEEFASIWLQFRKVGGFMTVGEADPYVSLDDTDGDQDPSDAAPELMAERIRMLAELVKADGGWAPSRLAETVGANRKSSTFQRALKLLIDAGEWVAEGATRNRRVRPSDLRHSADPLSDFPNGANGEPLFDPDQNGPELVVADDPQGGE
jgi:hypothetical protein